MKTIIEKREREIIVRRTFNGPARVVFDAWTKPELMKRWWVPKSLEQSMGMTLISCEMDVRTGGSYRLTFGGGMSFFGKYVEVVPNALLKWTNEENDEQGSVTTITFEEKDGKTVLTMTELFPSKEALEASGGAAEATHETFEQLDALLADPDLAR